MGRLQSFGTDKAVAIQTAIGELVADLMTQSFTITTDGHKDDHIETLKRRNHDLMARIEVLEMALVDIRNFGFANPGCGHTCAKKAKEVVGDV